MRAGDSPVNFYFDYQSVDEADNNGALSKYIPKIIIAYILYS